MIDFVETWSRSCDVIHLICHNPHLCTIFLTNIITGHLCKILLFLKPFAFWALAIGLSFYQGTFAYELFLSNKLYIMVPTLTHVLSFGHPIKTFILPKLSCIIVLFPSRFRLSATYPWKCYVNTLLMAYVTWMGINIFTMKPHGWCAQF